MFQSLSTICSADASGECKIWNLTTRKCVSSWSAHNALIRGAVFTPGGEEVMTVGDDKTIKTWTYTTEGVTSDVPSDSIVTKVNNLDYSIVLKIIDYLRTW